LGGLVIIVESVPLFKKFLDKNECKFLSCEFNKYLSRVDAKLWCDDLSADIRVFHAEKKILAFKPLYGAMLNYYKDVSGVTPKYSFLILNKISFIDNNLGSGGGWHRDSWRNQNKVFVFLTDVDEKSGPLQFANNSYSLISRCSHFIQERRSLRKKNISKVDGLAKSICIKSGDGFYLNTTCLHRGKPIERGFRIAVTLYAFDQNGIKLESTIKRFENL
jgi:hypothetical protein